ncbi:MAG: hypothetical protein ACRDR6_17200, partial [Pseudonocardiaceae bacterium]
MTINFKARVGHKLAANNRKTNPPASSVRTKRLAVAAIGLTAAVCTTLGANASTALAATHSTGTVATTTKPSAAALTGVAPKTRP